MDTSIKYIINPSGIASENFGDETIVIYISKGRYYSLAKSAVFMWSALSSPITAIILAQEVKNTYNISLDTAEKDVSGFISILKNEGLIIETDLAIEVTKEQVLSAESEKYEAPIIQTYTDMEDLILLDPVHDVDSKEGWPVKK